MGDAESGPVQLSFNSQLRVEFRGATVTSEAGLLLPRELDERLGLSALIERHLTDPRTGRTGKTSRPARRGYGRRSPSGRPPPHGGPSRGKPHPAPRRPGIPRG
jgi:hypothetical protein